MLQPLGADTILVVPALWCRLYTWRRGSRIRCSYDRSLEALTELKEYAEKVKVNIGRNDGISSYISLR